LSGVSIPNPYQQDQLGFGASWEIDLFGRVRRSVEAADADTAASIEDSRAVLVSMLGDIGRTYIDLRGAQAKRRVVLETIATEQDLLDLARQRRHAGLSSDIDVVRAAAEVTVARDREAVDLARQLYASGLGNFIDVLDAERTLQQNELLLADSSIAVSTDLVVLYGALGGGWS
jgi:outer membrane protein TolC